MKNITKLSFAAAAAFAAYSAPSQAAVLFDNGALKLEDTNLGSQPVNLTSISADQKTVYGTWGSSNISFTSTVNLDYNQGAATIFGAASNKGGLPDLTVDLGIPGFDQVGFALAGGSTYDLLVNGTTLISGITIPSGNTAFTLSGSGIQTLAFVFNPAADTAKQFRLDAISAMPVPEPGSWAMLIAGLGIVGASMRRRKTEISFG
jgi:hypothetical protein